MARIKFRDFSTGIHLTSQPDMAPRTSLRRALNIAPPTGGRLRAASPPLVRKSNVSIAVDGVFRYQDIYFAEGTSIGTHKFRRDNGADTWTDVTLPAAVGAGTAYNPTAVTGTQPAVALVASSKSTGVFAPPTDGAKEVLFLVDRRNSGPNLFKITDPTTGATARWGILPPTSQEVTGIGVAVATQDSAFINTSNRDVFQNATDNAAGDGGTGWTLVATDATDADGSTNSSIDTVSTPAVGDLALKIRAGRDDSAQVTHVFASNINLNTFPVASGGSGNGSTDEDYIQFYIRIRRPKHLVNVEIAFDTTTAGDFKKDFFSRELTFELVKRKKKRKLIALGDLIPVRNTQQFLKDNADKVKDLSQQADLGEQRIPVAKNTWTRVTLPKNTFEESGAPSWSTVRAVRVTVHANKQGRTAAFFDLLSVNGGVGMVGDYQYTATYATHATGTRSNPNISQDGIIAKVSISNVERQGVTLTFPSMVFDAQADRVEIWRTVGNGQAYFKVGEIVLTTPGSVTAGTSFTDKTSDYIGLNSASVDYTQAMGATGTWNGNSVLDSTELPLDNDSPNDPSFAFQDAVGIHVGRIWWTRNQRTVDIFNNPQDAQGQVYYSPAGRYEAVQAFLQVTSGKSDPVQKLIIWNDRLFALTTGSFYEIVGTDEPFIPQKIEGAPGTIRPDTVVASQEGIFWRAIDGIYNFNGQWAQNISDKDLQPVFKWREAVEDFAASIDYNEAEVGKNALWMLASGAGIGGTGGGFAPVLVFDFATGSWRTRDLTRYLKWDTVAGQMLGAVGTGTIDDLEPVPFNTGSTTQQLVIKTPVARVGTGQLGVWRKLFIDYDPAGETTLLPALIVDGVQTNLVSLTSTSGRRQAEFTVNKAGHDFQVLLSCSSANEAIEIFGIELDIYVPPLTRPDSGLQSN
jgi:hypothetical protein